MLAKEIRDFLKQLEEVIPPAKDQHHSLTFGQFIDDGSETSPAVERLVLSVREAVGWQSPLIFLLDEDMEKSVDALVAEVHRLVGSPEYRERRVWRPDQEPVNV